MLFWKIRSKYYMRKMHKIYSDIVYERISEEEGKRLWKKYALKNATLLKKVCTLKAEG